MSFYVQPNGWNGGLDAVTDAQMLGRRSPEMAARFDAIKELRTSYDDLATYTNHGRAALGSRDDGYMRVASVPHMIFAAALALEPDLLLNKTKFYAWLDRHPEYCTYTRRK